MAVVWRIGLLGELRADGQTGLLSEFGTRQTAGLLAYLAYYHRRIHPREVLIELLWPAATPKQGRNRLSVALSTLRRQLEPPGVPPAAVILSAQDGVGLSAETVTTDVEAFVAAVQAARAPCGDRQLWLGRALDLYTGPLLCGCYFDWVALERGRLEDLVVEVVRGLVAHRLAAGEAGAALEAARRGLTVDPLREELNVWLVRAAVAAGDSALARRQWREFEQRLADELSEQPSIEFEAVIADLAPPTPALVASVAPSTAVRPSTAGTTTVAAWRGQPRSDLGELTQGHRGWLSSADLASFGAARDAVAWASDLAVQGVAVALHSADPEPRDAAAAVARRLVAGAHLGQVLLTEATALLLADPGALRLLGRFQVGADGAATAVHQLSCPGLRQSFPPVALSPARQGFLPATLSRFFGRGEAIRSLVALLRDGQRLLSVTGGGGSGKTRLAIELGAQLLDEWQRAVWFVRLEALTDPELLVERALDVMKVDLRHGLTGQARLVEELRMQRSLLILDNFEHLPDAATAIVCDLLQQAPTLQCLVTTRRQLGVAGERVFELPPLDVPHGAERPEVLLRSASVAMFVDRAQAASPTFQLTPRNAEVVAALCAGLEGLPLALELAAARGRTMPPAAILAGLGERLDWAAKRRTGLPDRQHTLRHSLDWSYDLLPEPLRLPRRLHDRRSRRGLPGAVGRRVPGPLARILPDQRGAGRPRPAGLPAGDGPRLSCRPARPGRAGRRPTAARRVLRQPGGGGRRIRRRGRPGRDCAATRSRVGQPPRRPGVV
jgi:DNA-binding SARP family transcriptional activator